MLDDQDGNAERADRAQQIGQFLGLGVVQARRRLVQAQQLRLRHQRAHDFEQLLRAHRQFGRVRSRKGREADEIQHLLGARGAASRSSSRAPDSQSIWLGSEWRLQAMAADHHVLERGHARENPRRLEGADQAQLGDLHRREAGEVAPAKTHSPGIART